MPIAAILSMTISIVQDVLPFLSVAILICGMWSTFSFIAYCDAFFRGCTVQNCIIVNGIVRVHVCTRECTVLSLFAKVFLLLLRET